MSSASSIISHALILNVDDNDGARYAKSRILKHAGFDVIEANSGDEALKLAQTRCPSLILLDTKLPDINGFEVCVRLKSNPATQAILILQTSASYIGIGDKIKALDGGADNYLFEPIEPEELVANVRALVRLSKVERELREMDRRKDEFLATLAHELRNPLAPIRNALELMRLLDPVIPEKQTKAREIIQRHTDHLVRLVDDLLDVSRISQGKITLLRERVELKTFVNNALELSASLIETRRHSLTITMPDQPFWISGDPVRLTQIVANLLHNAAKFTLPGGKIQLTVRHQADTVVISVTDNGIGIAQESLSDIFALFAQVDHAADRVQDGLGIGLSLVQTLVKLHDGNVAVHSDGLRRGSTFEVTLPLNKTEENDLDLIFPVKHLSNSARILVIDDSVDSADTLAGLLAIGGHRVQVAYNGKQGIALAKKFLPEYVFLDIGLPDLSGYQVALILKALPELTDITLIALTGYGQAEDKKLAFDAGFDEHIVKPVDFTKVESLNLWSSHTISY